MGPVGLQLVKTERLYNLSETAEKLLKFGPKESFGVTLITSLGIYVAENMFFHLTSG